MMIGDLLEIWEIKSLGIAYRNLFIVFMVVLITSIVMIVIFYLYSARSKDPLGQSEVLREKYKSIFANVFLMGMVGGLAGQLGGSSREGVVGELIPAIFTLFGGYLAYYLGEKRDANGKIALNTVSFMLCFFTIYNISAIWRQSNENWQFCRELYANPSFSNAEQRGDRDSKWNNFCQPVFKQWTKVPQL